MAELPEMPCQELVEVITSYLDGSLGEVDRQRFEEHLLECDWCVRYVEQMRETLGLLGTVPIESLSPEAQATLLDAFRDLKR
jgi:anti-sigma factor RsiW